MRQLTDDDLDRGWILCPCGREAVIFEPGLISVAAVAMCPECGLTGVQNEENNGEEKD